MHHRRRSQEISFHPEPIKSNGTTHPPPGREAQEAEKLPASISTQLKPSFLDPNLSVVY